MFSHNPIKHSSNTENQMGEIEIPPPIILVIEEAGDGGTEVYVEGLARYLNKQQPVEIVTLSGSQTAARKRFEGLNVVALSGPTELEKFLKSRPVCIVNLHLYTSLLPAVRAVGSHKISLLITLHQTIAPWNTWNRLRWRLAVAKADQVIGVSKACLQGFGPFLHSDRSNVISAPLPLAILPAPSSPRANVFVPNILFVGRISREKNLPTLIRAVAKLKNATLNVVGDGADRIRCEKLTKDFGIDAKFHGALPRTEVFKLMERADFFVLPSKFEGLGIAAIEAMALGLPTVVSDYPAASEYIITDKTGLLFPIGDSTALAKCLKRLISDPKLRQTLSIEGARHVREVFSPHAQYGKYLKILKPGNSDEEILV